MLLFVQQIEYLLCARNSYKRWEHNRSDLFSQRADILVKLTFLCILLRNIYFNQKKINKRDMFLKYLSLM